MPLDFRANSCRPARNIGLRYLLRLPGLSFFAFSFFLLTFLLSHQESHHFKETRLTVANSLLRINTEVHAGWLPERNEEGLKQDGHQRGCNPDDGLTKNQPDRRLTVATQILSLPVPQPITEQIQTLDIRQREILQVLDLRTALARLQAELEERELSIKSRLDMGFAVEPGPRSASLKITERRNVSWKSVVERELGEGYAANVLSHTRPTITTSLMVG
jgi:hypothetical protein